MLSIRSKITMFIVLMQAITAAISFAAPAVTAISGTPSTITISGSGFGTKTQATPLWWDDSESGTVAANYNSIVGNNVYSTGSGQISSNSSRYLKFESFANYYNRWVSKRFASPMQNKMYVTFKWKWDSGYTWSASPKNDNEKIFFWSGDATGSTTNTAINVRTDINQTYIANLGGPWDSTVLTGFTPVAGQWYDIKAIVDKDYNGSTFNDYGNQASVDLWINNVHVSTKAPSLYFSSPGNLDMQEPHIGGWVSAATGRANDITYADNIYIDDTWQRVEIGNASTYTTSTIMEVQIPTAWSDNSVTVTLNQGSFSNFNGAYLYVSDANGNVNANGYPLCPKCPNPTTLNPVQ